MQRDTISFDAAARIYADNVSPRARSLDILERYANGSQYDGRPSFWDDEKPLRDRAPCIVVPVGELAADSNVDLCLGEGRAPTFSFFASEDDSVFDPAIGLTEDDAALLTRHVDACIEQSDFITAAQDALYWAQVHGTACAQWTARNGKLCLELHDAKWCTPTFNEDDPDEVESLEILYPYIKEEKGEGKLVYKCWLYRRAIDAKRDVTYKPAPASKDGAEPDAWIEDKVVNHNLGFCPVIWYRNARPGHRRALDGCAIHARVLDEIDAFNLALSQVHRAAITSTDPQIVETGVDENASPAPLGQGASTYIPDAVRHIVVDPSTGRPWDDRQWVSGDSQGRAVKPGSMARKRGPGVIWRYPDANSKVDLLTLPGDALTPASQNARSIYGFLKESLGVCFMDPEHTKMGADMSGRTLEWLHLPQIGRCKMHRKRFGRGFLLPALSMMLRLVFTTRGSLFVPGLEKARAILSRFHRQVEGVKSTTWFTPEMKITWGPWFAPTAADAKEDVETATAANQAGFITKRTAVEKMRQHYPDIGDVDQYLEALDEEAEEKAAKFHEAAAALMPPGEDDAQEGDEAAPAVPPGKGKPPVTKKAKGAPVVPPPKPGKVREPVAPKAKKPPVARKKVAAQASAD